MRENIYRNIAQNRIIEKYLFFSETKYYESDKNRGKRRKRSRRRQQQQRHSIDTSFIELASLSLVSSITASKQHGRPQSRASDTENWLSLTSDWKRKKIPQPNPPKRHLRKTASLPIYTATTICQKKTDYGCCSKNSSEMNLISENTNIGDSRSISISQDFIENGSGGNNCTFLPLDAELLPKYPRFGKKISLKSFSRKS